LDSRAIFKATTILSELHQGVLCDLLTQALGVGWDAWSRRHSTRPRYEITGVPETMMAEFSQRAEQIDQRRAERVAAFVAAHGRQPSPVEQMRIHQQGTLVTRPGKTHNCLAELIREWRHRADAHIRKDRQVAWVSGLKDRNDLLALRADDLGGPILVDAARGGPQRGRGTPRHLRPDGHTGRS
jgi:TrwC relaxase